MPVTSDWTAFERSTALPSVEHDFDELDLISTLTTSESTPTRCRGGIMGRLVYGDAEIAVEIDDRALTHLQIVIGAKLRRGESFFFSWADDPRIGTGRSSLWLHRSIPLYFKFFGGKTPAINQEWIVALNDSANSGQGLVFMPEPGRDTPAPRGRVQ